jgi:hypothetical protein
MSVLTHTHFNNYAGWGVDQRIDTLLTKELQEAGIPAVESLEFLRGKIGCEINTIVMGEIGSWSFERYWRYWVVKGPGIPLEEATKLHQDHGQYCRVNGNCRCPAPSSNHGFPIGNYHVDTAEALKALANTIKSIYHKHDYLTELKCV